MNYCYCAFDAICNQPCDEELPKAPMFVTWTINGKLRGCVGSFSESNIHDIAIKAANDSRFEPIQPSEIPYLMCCVNILHTFEPTTAYDWVVGTHGVTVENRGTYLPIVPVEQSWDAHQTIKHLIDKASLDYDMRHKYSYTRF